MGKPKIVNLWLDSAGDRKAVCIEWDNGRRNSIVIGREGRNTEVSMALLKLSTIIITDVFLIEEPKKAPWKDYEGNDIYAGDVLVHPSSMEGMVVYYKERTRPEDAWRVQYADHVESRLCLQIDEKGQGVVRR